MIVRRAIRVTGVVQGVGFRPFVHQLARAHGLGGFVRNDAGAVLIEVEGDAPSVGRFLGELPAAAPATARIAAVDSVAAAPRGETGFHIAGSTAGDGAVAVPPDLATCDACLREVEEAAGRRSAWAFTSCTACGPRLTIVESAPIDRERTTMAAFPLCDTCAAEYRDPGDRRFHAQATACPACGPRLAIWPPAPGDPITLAARALSAGGIVAIKGIGGYHLACAADHPHAAGELRRRKHRDHKPFAIMVRDLAAARRLCQVDVPEGRALLSPARPIVLLRRLSGAGVAAAVAPGSHELGVILPYTPLHHLLLAAVAPSPLVMTSGNRSDEPIAIEDGDARERLGGIADSFLLHDRAIRTRCDDSVVRLIEGRPLFLRRSRGHAPLSVPLPDPLAVPTLALGGHLKAVFALGEGARAIPSHHIGDLDHPEALRAWRDALQHYERLFGVRPRRLVADLHPDYASTRHAEERAREEGLELVLVQHHHAHLASLLADTGHRGRAIGVCFDGAGLGDDGTIWGGEFLVGDAGASERAAHLAPVPLAGGEQAIRQPWRMAVAHAVAAGVDPALVPALAGQPGRAQVEHLARSALAPRTSSVGRLFDAVAAIAGVCALASHEGQPAMLLESMAASAPGGHGSYPYALRDPLVVDPGPIIAAAVRDAAAGTSPAIIAARLHAAVIDFTCDVCERLRAATGIDAAGLTGGVFANAILTRGIAARLERAGFRVLRHREVPPGDGGLALGQLATVAARDRRGAN
jgi:hydrogenase maturation protein HypF